MFDLTASLLGGAVTGVTLLGAGAGWVVRGRCRAPGCDQAKAEPADAEAQAATRLALEKAATHDALSGLPGRGELIRRVADSLPSGSVASRDAREEPCVLLLLNIDGFRAVNEELGLPAADTVLATVGQRLRGVVREQDTVARIGADEFAVLLAGPGELDPSSLLPRLHHAASSALTFSGVPSLTVSIGIARPTSNVDAAGLLANADLAMRRAKGAGGNATVTYHDSMRDDRLKRRALEHDLSQAIGRDELWVAYQPIADLDSGTLTGFEALLRWTHPVLGNVGPDVFIPVAEATGQINRLGDWVMLRALTQLRSWQVSYAWPELTMAVNLSPEQLTDPDLPDRVRRTVQRSGVDPRSVILEVTESLAMDSDGPAIQRLWQLKALGLRLALDDFGTGHSSLARLSTLPIDKVKIDQAFISPLTEGDPDLTRRATLLRAAIAMTQGLGLRVVAEGIETDSQVALLKHLGCHEGQGYYLGRPADALNIDIPAVQWHLPQASPELLDSSNESTFVPRLMPSQITIPVRRRAPMDSLN